jgi:hypothetical protein
MLRCPIKRTRTQNDSLQAPNRTKARAHRDCGVGVFEAFHAWVRATVGRPRCHCTASGAWCWSTIPLLVVQWNVKAMLTSVQRWKNRSTGQRRWIKLVERLLQHLKPWGRSHRCHHVRIPSWGRPRVKKRVRRCSIRITGDVVCNRSHARTAPMPRWISVLLECGPYLVRRQGIRRLLGRFDWQRTMRSAAGLCDARAVNNQP